MPDLPAELIRVNAILGEYVAIHDASFKLSWLTALPLPGLLKAIDFGAHFTNLRRFASDMPHISSNLKREQGSLAALHQ